MNKKKKTHRGKRSMKGWLKSHLTCASIFDDGMKELIALEMGKAYVGHLSFYVESGEVLSDSRGRGILNI